MARDEPGAGHSRRRSLQSLARETLEGLRARNLLRTRRVVEHWPGPLELAAAPDENPAEPLAIVDGELKHVFCSNDYLALSRDPRVIAAFQHAAAVHGVGSGASHLVTGHHREHHALEEELAAFVGRERALLFSTGYHANLGIVAALLRRHDFLVEDRLNHASLVDAAVLSRAGLRRYAHADTVAADEAIARCAAARPGTHVMVATDGVFSMDGDVAPLAELARSARRHGAWLLVDDAHGLGAMGPGGRGTAATLPGDDVPLLMGTLGKAFGTFGAFVAADRDVIELLLQSARPYIYTTGLPPAVAAATRVALRIVMEEESRRTRLADNVRRFREGARQRGLALLPSETAIQPIVTGTSASALAASEGLWARGFWVAAIRPPTVPEGGARLRVTLNAGHSPASIDNLLDALAATFQVAQANG